MNLFAARDCRRGPNRKITEHGRSSSLTSTGKEGCERFFSRLKLALAGREMEWEDEGRPPSGINVAGRSGIGQIVQAGVESIRRGADACTIWGFFRKRDQDFRFWGIERWRKSNRFEPQPGSGEEAWLCCASSISQKAVRRPFRFAHRRVPPPWR